MTLPEKQEVAAVVRKLIRLLENCDDEEFVALVLECVCDGDLTPLSSERL